MCYATKRQRFDEHCGLGMGLFPRAPIGGHDACLLELDALFGLPVTYNMLQYVWFNLPGLWDWKSVHVVHYQYEKPWQTDNPKRDQLQPLIDLWWSYRTGEDVPDIDELDNPA